MTSRLRRGRSAYALDVDPILGVDLGTTYTAAATNDARGVPEMVALGNRTAEIPSVLLLKSDGEFLVGEAAERRAFSEPDRVARQFKRRLGDATPLLLGGSPFSPEALMGRVLKHVVSRASALRGARFASTVVCHPANWGPYRMELLGQAAKMAEIDDVRFLPEPVAAAVHYTGQAKLDPDEIVVVYDFGGGTFDVAVLQRRGESFEVIGTPAGLEHLGGLDLDEAVFGHVTQSLAGSLAGLDGNDPAVITAVGRLRDECKAAKEALSSDTDTSIPVLLPGIQTEIRITRAEFEAMILPSIIDTVATTTRAIRDAGIEATDVGRVLLVGGSARVPLVAQLLGEELGRPIVIDTHPKHAIALGAALWGATEVRDVAAPTPAPVAPETDPPVAPADDEVEDGDVGEAEDTAAHEPVTAAPETVDPPPAPVFTEPQPVKSRSALAARLAIGAVLVALLGAGIGFAVSRGGSGDEPLVTTVSVPGTRPYTDTGIALKRGDVVTVEAEGEVFHNPDDKTGPDGVNNPDFDQFSVIGGENHNGLIAKVGRNGTPFFVGRSHTFTAGADGPLFLGVNDTGVANNSGAYEATVEVE